MISIDSKQRGIDMDIGRSIERIIDNIEDEDALKLYEPNKKNSDKEELFISEEYKDKAKKFAQTDKEELTKKVTKGIVIVSCVIIASIIMALASVWIYKSVKSKAAKSQITEGQKQFVSQGVWIDKQNIPVIQKIKNRNKGINVKNDKANATDTQENMLAEKIEISTLVKALGVEEEHIVGAYKIYNGNGKVIFKNMKYAKTILTYDSEYNGFRNVKFTKKGDIIETNIYGDTVVVAFNITSNFVIEEIKYRYIDNNLIANELIDTTTGVKQYNKIFSGNNFKTKFSIVEDIFPFKTIWDMDNGPASIGQAAVVSAKFNGVDIGSYKNILDAYELKWLAPLDYSYDITEFSKEKISDIEFRSKRLLDTEVDGRKPIDTKLLPRPDKEYAGIINHLNNTILDMSINNIAVGSTSDNVDSLNNILKELQSGNTVLCVMSNEDGIHAVTIYGVYQSEIDSSVYNFAVYDSNINDGNNKSLNILQARIGMALDEDKEYKKSVKYNYGNGAYYNWDSNKEDCFIFYVLRTNLAIDKIGE